MWSWDEVVLFNDGRSSSIRLWQRVAPYWSSWLNPRKLTLHALKLCGSKLDITLNLFQWRSFTTISEVNADVSGLWVPILAISPRLEVVIGVQVTLAYIILYMGLQPEGMLGSLASNLFLLLLFMVSISQFQCERITLDCPFIYLCQ